VPPNKDVPLDWATSPVTLFLRFGAGAHRSDFPLHTTPANFRNAQTAIVRRFRKCFAYSNINNVTRARQVEGRNNVTEAANSSRARRGLWSSTTAVSKIQQSLRPDNRVDGGWHARHGIPISQYRSGDGQPLRSCASLCYAYRSSDRWDLSRIVTGIRAPRPTSGPDVFVKLHILSAY
jgi:hypothetical protein